MRRWTRREASTEGEVGELLVWAALEAQSAGALHVFLPVWDQGLDALVHRLPDGAYLPVQVKVRRPQPDGSIHLAIPPSALTIPDALLVAAPLLAGALGEWALVMTEAAFAEAGSQTVHPDRPPWSRHVVATSALAERLGAAPTAVPTAAPVAAPAPPGWLGRLGEAEVVRRLAERQDLQLFRALPDDELVEVAARAASSGAVAGLQVKAIGLDARHPDSTVMIRRATFRASPSTWLAVLAWHREAAAFDAECLLIPSGRVEEVARADGDHLRFDYHPQSGGRSRLDAYRLPLAELGRVILPT